MKLTFWGAAGTVTGSSHALTVPGGTYLLDCGLFQGHRREALSVNSNFAVAPASVRSVVLSHAHLDHSGNLPSIVRNGFSGTIHSTSATADLCRFMLADSAHLQEKDAEFMERRNARRRVIGVDGQTTPVPPLYTTEDAEQTTRQFSVHPYYFESHLDDELAFEFRNAGHILGSAFVLLNYSDGGRETKLLFSGDLGRPSCDILRERDPAPEADYLILESTYGDRIHPPRSDTEANLASLINETVQRGGHVVVPAFAVGRTQQLVLALHHLVEKNLIPEIPIFVDSPLAIDVTRVFERHLEDLGCDAASYIQSGTDPFGFRRLRYLREASESKTLNDLRTPFVVISASGMCEGGRVLHHLQHSVQDPRNLVLITGFQAPNTLGRRISEQQPEVRIFGESIPLRAQVAALNELSGHADQSELISWVAPIAKNLKAIFLIHGEPSGRTALAKILHDRFQLKVVAPARGESFDLT